MFGIASLTVSEGLCCTWHVFVADQCTSAGKLAISATMLVLSILHGDWNHAAIAMHWPAY